LLSTFFYSPHMKFALFICMSLLASLLHAAAMPIADMGNRSMTHKVEMTGEHTPEQHAKMMQGEHHDAEELCPDNNYSCCMASALQPDLLLPHILSLSQAMYASLPSVSSRLKPDGLYRPPKLYPVLAG